MSSAPVEKTAMPAAGHTRNIGPISEAQYTCSWKALAGGPMVTLVVDGVELRLSCFSTTYPSRSSRYNTKLSDTHTTVPCKILSNMHLDDSRREDTSMQPSNSCGTVLQVHGPSERALTAAAMTVTWPSRRNSLCNPCITTHLTLSSSRPVGPCSWPRTIQRCFWAKPRYWIPVSSSGSLPSKGSGS